jgi:hypothetical protein
MAFAVDYSALHWPRLHFHESCDEYALRTGTCKRIQFRYNCPMLTYQKIADMEGVCPATVRKYGTEAFPPSRRLKVIKKSRKLHQITEVDYQQFLQANKTK